METKKSTKKVIRVKKEAEANVRKAKVVNALSLRIRKEPSIESEQIGIIIVDNVFDVLEIGTEWHKVRHNGVEGYSMAKYIDFVR